MRTFDNARPVRIAYVGGGSLNWATKLMGDLAHDGTLTAEVALYDIDHAAAERNARIGQRYSAAAPSAKVTYTAEKTLAAALTGADFVVISILPGTFAEMASDIAIPERYGIVQSVGDTVGPGGFIRALRAIPAIYEIGLAIGEHCPKAYVVNLTNPMSVLTGALFRAFPDIRAWGACHEVIKTRRTLAFLANQKRGEIHYRMADAKVNVLGINHFTWVNAMSVDGVDMMADYLAFAEQHRDSGWRERPIDMNDEHERYFEDMSKVKFDLTCRFGIAAAAGDRHLAEFVPQSWYLDRHRDFAFGLTPVEYRIRERSQKVAAAEALDSGAPLPPPAPSEEAIVEQLRALLGGEEHVSNVNLPNRGQVAGLPEGVIVETNARFSGLGIQPVFAGRLPPAVETLVLPHALRQTALLDAVLNRNADALLPLFLSDPLVQPIGLARAEQMFGEMIAATRHCLPQELACYCIIP
ncbi:family 4 glycosyl hydrolase [Rhizobium paknamense]|uniref:Alpha-galactosidase n=1 Tax=Rhizobium paknamense TaxID=1206817 RepID=A0ABU0IDP3_9HYPH|nr:alpha-galactosidase [Rhizobium paknamense]MDQ0456296.1 alpha-galactosidase [Rhizobium paknamense]